MEAFTTLRRNNKGTTLAEMIVTFALVGIFLVSASGIISSAVLVHGELTATMYAQSVGEMLLDKITGELCAASNTGSDAMIITERTEQENYSGNEVAYYDRDGRAARILVEDGLLVIHYDELVRVQDDGEVLTLAEQDWKLDGKAYMGYRISELQIERLNDSNVMEVKLKIKNLKTGFEYSASKCTKCYNFKTEDNTLSEDTLSE